MKDFIPAGNNKIKVQDFTGQDKAAWSVISDHHHQQQWPRAIIMIIVVIMMWMDYDALR